MTTATATPDPAQLGASPEALATLMEQGWVLVDSTVLGEPVVWYRQGFGRLIPRDISADRVTYRVDELALLADQHYTEEQFKALHEVKRVFHRSTIVDFDSESVVPHSAHVGFVWKGQGDGDAGPSQGSPAPGQRVR